MINNARAESDARLARQGDGNALGESASDYGDEKRNGTLGEETEEEDSGSDDEYDGHRSRHDSQRITKRECL